MEVASKLSVFFAELKRRKVYRVAVVCVVVGAGIIGLADAALPSDVWERLQIPIVALVLVGLPIALVLAWAYEVKPEEPRVAEKAPVPAIDTSAKEARKSIVVLPFDNMSPDPNDAYFSDGLTEEIITNLSYLHSLRVISRNSAMALKGTQKDTRTIAEELDVQYVLEGGVRKAGNDLRITAQLIDATSDEHLWAEKYDGVLDDVFEVQETVSQSIVEALNLTLTSSEKEKLVRRPIDNVQAYDCYLRARYHIESYTKEGFERALQHLRNGLSIMGENALLLAGIGYTHWNCANQGIGGTEEVDRAEQYGKKALALDPDCAEAHLVLGLVYQAFRGDQRQAFHHLTRSLVIKPNDPHTVLYTFFGHYAVGRPDASSPQVERLLQLDPLNPLIRWLPAGIDMAAGRFDRAADFAWDQLPPTPNFVFMRALALAYARRFDNAQTLIRESVKDGWDDVFGRLCRLIEAAIEREAQHMEELLTGDCARTCRRDPMWSYWVASILAWAREEDAAFDWLTNAVGRGFINYPLLAEHDPFLVKLRGQPQFEALMERVKHEWESFQV